MKALALVWLLSGTAPAAGAGDPDTGIIDAYVAQHAKQLQGQEYQDARKVVAGDLDNDGIPDKIVLYTIEGQGGSNNYTQYMAVFIRSKTGIQPVARIPVGGKSVASVENVAVRDHIIRLTELQYGPDDPSCCPSKKAEVRYALVGHTLKKQTSPAN